MSSKMPDHHLSPLRQLASGLKSSNARWKTTLSSASRESVDWGPMFTAWSIQVLLMTLLPSTLHDSKKSIWDVQDTGSLSRRWIRQRYSGARSRCCGVLRQMPVWQTWNAGWMSQLTGLLQARCAC